MKSMTNSFWNHPISTIEKALHIRKQIETIREHLDEIIDGRGEVPLSFSAAPDNLIW